jgi:hypothetical protein
MDGYSRAWRSNDPADIRALFTDDAEYRTEPWVEPWRGIDAIVSGWLDRQDEPDTAGFIWSVLVETDAIVVVEATTDYRDGPTYANLWVVRFGSNGQATRFTEWWMDQSKPS